MIRFLFRTARARATAAPALTLLSVMAIALGSGAVLAVDLLNRAAIETMDASLELVSGQAGLVVRGIREQPASVPDEAWPGTLGVPGVGRVAPIVRIPSVEVSRGGVEDSVALLGVDIFTGSFAFATEGDPGGLSPGGIALPRPLARRIGAVPGDAVRVTHAGRSRELPVALVYEPGSARGDAFVDLSLAQEVRGVSGFDRLEVEPVPTVEAAVLARRIEAAIPFVVASTSGALRDQGADLFAAFRLNLRALGAVSLLVAAFLIYASIRTGLRARRKELGLYRALGARADQVALLLLGEVAATAFLGAVLGVPLAALGASAALDGVSATLTNFYLLERVENLALRPEGILIALATGLLAALAGAVPEILAESRRPPVHLLRPGQAMTNRGARRSLLTWTGGLGVVLMAFACFAVLRPENPLSRLGGGFVAAAAILAGAALLSGAVLRLGGRARADRRNVFLRGMAAGLREAKSSAPPAAALVVAVAMLTGVSGLIGSFRSTLDDWLGQTLAADFYVSRDAADPGAAAREARPLSQEALRVLGEDPDVEARDFLRAIRIRLNGRPVNVLGVSASLPEARGRFAIVGEREEALRDFAGGGVLVSENLSRREGWNPAKSLLLPSPTGNRELRIAGVFRDYGNELGSIFLDLPLLNRIYPEENPPVHGVALYLREGADPQAVEARLDRRLEGSAVLVDNASLRTSALDIFDQTMSVTALLRGVALLIAATGLGLALFTVSRERAPQIALERALGATRGQVALGLLGRGVVIALSGLLLGGIAGAILTLLLIEVVNPFWFGWRLDLEWPVGVLASQGALVLLAGLLAAAIPARYASKTGPVALREEL